MISVSELSMTFGQKVLFEKVSLRLTTGNCYGLIGANGAGKSTFLKIVTGEVEQTAGQVILDPGKRMGWLRRVLDVALQGHTEFWKLQQQMNALYEKGDFSDADGEKLGKLQERFESIDGYSQETNAAQVLQDLGIVQTQHDDLMGSLDSAQKVRVLLAQALFSKPDLLLLDEPTNNLDMPAIVWLEKFLADYEGCVVVVSHDRHFLNRICTHTCDCDFRTIRAFVGSYDLYMAQEQLARAQRSKEAGRVERQVKRLKSFVERFKSNAARSKQATSRVKQIDALQGQKVVPSSRVAPRLLFKTGRASGQDIIEFENVSFHHDDSERMLVKNLSLRIDRGDRIGVVGRNGMGKTTLMRLIMGELQPIKGTVAWGSTTTRAYFPQDGGHLFSNKEATILDWLKQFTDNQDINNMRAMLGRMLFSGDDVKKQVGVLSGGEKVRCLLSMVMLQEANVLILDEPTSHLDLESIEALQEGLEDFQGTLVFVSHDREFIDTLSTRTFIFDDDGSFTDWKGNYQAFRLARDLE
jgi:ATPase subunit of ABC transporter with duplicated ATPase domains